jgi:hypothetical protein
MSSQIDNNHLKHLNSFLKASFKNIENRINDEIKDCIFIMKILKFITHN